MFLVRHKMYGGYLLNSTAYVGGDWTYDLNQALQFAKAANAHYSIPKGQQDFCEVSAKETEMAKAGSKGGRPKKIATQAAELMAALRFVASGADKDDALYMKHIRLSGGWAVSFDGQIAAGHPIKEELNLCPHIDKLLKALEACGKTLALTETATGRLSVKGEKLNAVVPCLPWGDMPQVQPDPGSYPIDDRVKDAFKACAAFSSEAGDDVIKASLLLEANECTATNRHAMLQYWHGVDLPPGIVIPKLFAAAVCKHDKKLTNFGFSWFNLQEGGQIVGSFTIYFEDGSWLKTQTYADRWPDVNNILNRPAIPGPVPDGLFEAVEAVAAFDEGGVVTFQENRVVSHASDEHGAQYDVPGLPGGKRFGGKLLRMIAPFTKTIDLTTHHDRLHFFGDSIRGAVMAYRSDTYQPQEPEPQQQGWGQAPAASASDQGGGSAYELDDDIPY